MQHADGELDDAGERALAAHLADDAEARAKVEAVKHVGEVVRGHLEMTGDAVPEARFAAMWREIDKQLGVPAANAAAIPATIPAAPATEPAGANAVDAMGAWKALTRWLDRKLGYILTGVASAGAVAAIALVMRPAGDSVDLGDQGRSGTGAPLAPIPVVHRPAQIESLDTPGGQSTVLRLQDEDGDATVIWVTPDDIEGT